MKRFLLLLGLVFATMQVVEAQISIDEVKAEQRAEFRDSLKTTSADTEYFNEARYRAERAAIRKERNFLEMGGALQGTLSSYNDAWISTSGGDNSVAIMATMRLYHTFTKEKFTIENKLDAKFGYNRMNVEYEDGDEGVWFKNQDEFAISTAPAYKFTKNWNFGAILKFRSQFANGYVSRTEQEPEHRKSRFMAPGYLDISVGFTYNCPLERFPVKINLSPVAMSTTFVRSEAVKEYFFIHQGETTAYGIEDPMDSSLWEGGSSIQIDFDRTWGKSGWFRYRTSLYSFFGWITSIGRDNKYCKFDEYQDAMNRWNNPDDMTIGHEIGDKPHLAIHPTVRWENTLEIKASKFLATQINFQLYYNRAQNYDLQMQALLSIGLSYTFKNK